MLCNGIILSQALRFWIKQEYSVTSQLTKEALAEFIGTFMFVLVGAGAVAASSVFQPQIEIIVAALSHGLILVAIITQYGQISGAHVNPAVTVALLVGGKINARKAGVYIASQFVGGLVAALVLRIIFTDISGSAATLGQTIPNENVNELGIIIVELLLTFFLISSVYHAAVYARWGNLSPLLIGFTFAGCVLFGSPLTGASLNPARTLGPALLAENTQDLGEVLVYFIGIFGGGALAGFAQSTFFASET